MSQTFKLSAWFEGLTLLVLIFLAMPAKYYWGNPKFVSMVGPIHGLAFLAYQYLLLRCWIEESWDWKYSLKLSLASFVPFGTILALRGFSHR